MDLHPCGNPSVDSFVAPPGVYTLSPRQQQDVAVPYYLSHHQSHPFGNFRCFARHFAKCWFDQPEVIEVTFSEVGEGERVVLTTSESGLMAQGGGSGSASESSDTAEVGESLAPGPESVLPSQRQSDSSSGGGSASAAAAELTAVNKHV